MNLRKLVLSQKQEIRPAAHRHGACNIRVFDSIARNEEGAASDVDFLVEMEPGRTLLDLGGLQMDLQDLLQVKVDIVTEAGLRKRIKDDVLHEAVVL